MRILGTSAKCGNYNNVNQLMVSAFSYFIECYQFPNSTQLITLCTMMAQHYYSALYIDKHHSVPKLTTISHVILPYSDMLKHRIDSFVTNSRSL